ncbi:hypothetical protein MA16_Dca009737 [Dendrobium catenatum]|uniref:Uncharacterized protein n=1 Tax=Dendrobium catenatum TaxID=906689 RepID=A0A2I0VQL9_9ASPA|nr:hypothetical protein MA16_Dca009737 [Dendrobium catenatum]
MTSPPVAEPLLHSTRQNESASTPRPALPPDSAQPDRAHFLAFKIGHRFSACCNPASVWLLATTSNASKRGPAPTLANLRVDPATTSALDPSPILTIEFDFGLCFRADLSAATSNEKMPPDSTLPSQSDLQNTASGRRRNHLLPFL